MTTAIAEIAQLSVAERIQLVEDIWDTIAARPDDIPLTEAQVQELDRRLEFYEANPGAGTSWDEVRQRVQGRR